MSLFKKWFGSTNSTIIDRKRTSEIDLTPFKNTPWMTDVRLKNVEICLNAGFKPSNSLPTEFEHSLRPSIEIAQRLNAIKALVLWTMIPEDDLSNQELLNFIKNNALDASMSDQEKEILSTRRNDEGMRNSIGWKFENTWPLAWYFGYRPPEISGKMMSGEEMNHILREYTCPLDWTVEEWMVKQPILSVDEVKAKEDLFYCLHNAVRSAQMGANTVPEHFDPIANGGVIHERRHALTWMLSKGVDWDNTDLST